MGHSLGWIQNPGKFENLKKVVGIFVLDSNSNLDLKQRKLPLILHNNLIEQSDYDNFISLLNQNDIKIDYKTLKGKGGKRGKALCSGIVQAAINGQQDQEYKDLSNNKITLKKLYVDDWSSDGFLRWGISLGLIDCDEDDNCTITDLGKEFLQTKDNSEEEIEFLRKVFLSYPPMCRFLQLLSEGETLTKFDIGKKLGFTGEPGFTSIPVDYYIAMCAHDSKNISNLEGDADKYARGIASWAYKVGWITKEKKFINVNYLGVSYGRDIAAYKITIQGLSDYKKTTTYSSNSGIPKFVFYEMLATKANGASLEYLRYRRSNIIKFISAGDKTLESIQKHLKTLNINDSIETIKDEIENLKNIGLNIKVNNSKYKIIDKIEKLDIPQQTKLLKDNILEIKDNIRSKLKYLSHDYLILVDLAYSDASNKSAKNADAREFEIKTADLLTKELNFKGMRLGDSNRPDIIISYDKNGVIIDNKSYKDGFSLEKSSADEMSRYVNQNKKRQPNVPDNEWWKQFDKEVDNFYFMFISSCFIKNYKKNLLEIAALTDTKGAAINVENLLYISDKLKGNTLEYEEFFNYFNNDEIIMTTSSPMVS